MDEPITILIIEDSPADYLFVERHLKQHGLSVRCSRVDNLKEVQEALDRESWDLVLADYNLPDFNFLDGLNLVRTACPDLPVIMVTGAMGEEKAVELLKHGVWDFVLKDNLARLVPAIQRSLMEKRALDERRSAEERLKESEAMYRSLFENMINSLAYCRMLFDGDRALDFIHLNVNEAFTKQTGLKDVVGKRMSELYPGIRETDPDFFELFGRVAMTGNPEQVEIYVKAMDEWFWISVYSPAREHFVAIFDVITERKQAEELLQKKNAEIEQFIYTVSHDLRSPLVTMKTFLGYLEKDMTGDNKEHLVQDIKFINDAADKMKLRLDELLELSRIGRIETAPVRISFMELATDSLNTLAGAIQESKTSIHLHDADVMLFGDRPRLSMIWQNLIENALKYGGNATPLRIELGVRQENGETLFFVKDNGIGIEPQYHRIIFGIFEKLDPQSPGAGMGLSLIKRIVEKHGGRIWVESEGIGTGSCFNFTLPLAMVQS